MQRFYGTFVRDVNLALDVWLKRCMPGRSVHVPLQRMVMLARQAPGCVLAITRPLARALHLDEAAVANATFRFAAASLPLVQKSLAEARAQQQRLASSSHQAALEWAWPVGSALQPAPCAGRATVL